jgi:hypothetical protein
VLNPGARRLAVRAYVGTLVAVFLIAGAALLFWLPRHGQGVPGVYRSADPTAVGTSGGRMPREGTPGGFNPEPDHESTQSEVEFRGGGEPAQGPARGLGGVEQVELKDVEVERAEGATFWVRHDGKSIAVVAAGNTPSVRAGQKVNVTGTSEDGGKRIRASRIEVGGSGSRR